MELIADNILPDQNSQYPVRIFYRNITELFLRFPIAEGNLPQIPVSKFIHQPLIARPLIHLGIRKFSKNVLTRRKIPEVIIGQTLTVTVIQVAVCLIGIRLQRQGA